MVDSSFDPSYAEKVGREVIAPLAEHYFRVKVVGLEATPDPRDNRPIIFLANHAGRAFPWDAILLDYTVSRYWVDDLDLNPKDKPRSLSAPDLSCHPLLLPFRLENWWRRMGCVDATAANFGRLLRQGKNVIIFPEGIPGIARDFKDRYQLLPFPTPMVRLAEQYNALLVPVSIVGSEYFHPYARRVKLLDMVARRLKLPFLHLSPFLPLLPFFPWLFYVALPAPVTIYFGKALSPADLKTNGQDWESVTTELRRLCQEQLNETRSSYENGMQWWGLIKALAKAPRPAWKLLPHYWPSLFIRHAAENAPQLFPNIPPRWWFWLPLLGWTRPPTGLEKPTNFEEPLIEAFAAITP